MRFWISAAVLLAITLGAAMSAVNEYFFYAGFIVLQLVVLATAWNILGGYAGYVNFGTSAFFGIGAYTAVVLFKAVGAPLAVQIAGAALVGGLLGFGVGMLTLRLRGIFFAIATVAVVFIMETLMINWRYVGGATGLQLLRPETMAPFGSYTRMLFVVMALIAVAAVAIARYIQTSWLGRGLRAIRDTEEAAETCGVPTLKLKLFACVVSGALMAAAGAPMPMYLSFIEPASSFSLNYAIGALAAPMIGGTTHWLGPVIGALLLASLQQIVTVTISNEINVLVVGVLLVFFVVAAPEGIVGLFRKWARSSKIKDVSKRFGGFTALAGVSLDIAQGERFGLIGPNGSGKTTLINCISGALRNESGSIVFDGEEISRLPAYLRTRRGVARTFQVPRPFVSMSVLENLLVPLQYVAHRQGVGGAGHPRAHRARRQGGNALEPALSGRVAQAGARARACHAAAPADLRRGDGGPLGQRSRRGPENPVRPERRGDHGDHDRAHHAGSDALLAARRVPRRRTDHLRRHARADHRQR